MIKKWILGLLLACVPALGLAADATTQLRQFIETVRSATGQFEQQRLENRGNSRAQTGQFAFKQPGQFLWQVEQPYEQLVLSDGKVLYQYDPDLAQVTRRPVSQSIGASPAAILFGSGSLDQAFTLTNLPADQGLDWLRAQPRNPEAGFTHVDIGFRNGLPARLLLLDAFGQTTRINLSNITRNPALDVNRFTFTPPPGVDVVNMQ